MDKQINKNLLICRTCLCSVKSPDQFIPINNYAKTLNCENILVIDMIEKCIPELDLGISDNAIICNLCYDMLISTYQFKSKCFQTEEKVYLFVEANSLTLGDKINLIDLVEDSNFNECSKFEHFEPLQSRAMAMSNTRNTTFKVVTAMESEINLSASDSEEENENKDCKGSEMKQKEYLKRQYSCDKCEYKGYRSDLLKKHLLFKCKSKTKSVKYKCDKCSYATIRQRQLTRHKLVHGGERPYICGICDRGFTEKYSMRYHIMYKHSGVQLPYKCGEGDCEAMFRRKCDLNAHIIKHVD